jgi:aminopeptidase N
LTIEGPESWTLNSVGTIKESTVREGRKRVVWKTESPVRFFNIVGGPLTQVEGADVKVFHDDRTSDNVKTMVEALAAARRRYSEWFGPYPWHDLKLTQFPGLAGYAQGFPGNISFSEAIGFLTLPSKGEESLDSAFYVVAHESGHQWWGNIVTPGQGPGGNIVSEGIANFSAAMLMHHERGEAQRRVLLRRWENTYVNRRSADSERPINRTDGSRPGDQTITYDRAGFVFWMLRESMGEQAMLAGMKEFVSKWKDGVETSTGLDFPLIEDFVEALKPHAPDPAKFDAFVSQWIFGTVLPEFSLDAIKVEPAGPGQRVSGTIANIGTGETDVVVRIIGNKSDVQEPPHHDLTVHLAAGQPPTPFTAEVDFTPEKLVVDPDVNVLQAGRKRAEKALR